MKDRYIKAAREALNTQPIDSVIEGLTYTLRTRGHEKLLIPVLRGLMCEIKNSESSNKAHVTLARADAQNIEANSIAKLLTTLGAKDYDIDVDASLIGGMRVQYQNRVIDTSFKKKLIHLYKTVIQ
ncbi:MAG TPA: F0F1 ATP synthase subunit delta [Candidatus Paceibacterota bacterium]|nr:F0F1 ATP synthase subunit delta [Candidatus Paceibacterota bacterium]